MSARYSGPFSATAWAAAKRPEGQRQVAVHVREGQGPEQREHQRQRAAAGDHRFAVRRPWSFFGAVLSQAAVSAAFSSVRFAAFRFTLVAPARPHAPLT